MYFEKRFRSVFVLLLALGSLIAGACSCNETETTGRSPKMSIGLDEDESGRADFILDFGTVSIGSKAKLSIEVRNEGSSSLVAQVERPVLPFGLEMVSSPLEVGVGAARSLSFTYQPKEELGEPEEALLQLTTNEGRSSTIYSIRLIGRGANARLECEPAPLDFDRVVAGSQRTLPVHCTNPLAIPLDVVVGSIQGNFASNFSAVAEGAVEGRALIPAGESLRLDVQFRASAPGTNDAVLILRDPYEVELAAVDLLGQTVHSALQFDPASCLDFAYVGLGERAERTLLLRNAGDEALEVIRILLPDGESAFSVVEEAPLSLPVGEEGLKLTVAFEPTVPGKRTSQIAFVYSDSKGTQTLNACVTGFGGGPSLACNPNMIDFGMTAIGIPVVLTYTCHNDGVPPPGETVDPLVVTGLSSDHPAFSAQIRNLSDGSVGAKPNGYREGEGFIVEVRYDPQEEAFETGTISIESSSAGGVHHTNVVGTGRDLPSCEFTIQPPSLRFGIVDRGKELTQSFVIRNQLDTACLINDLHLTDDSDPAYSVETIESMELGPNESLRVPVTFAPDEYRPLFSGTVRFQISNKEQPIQEIPLRGTSEKPCLILEPDPVDFGHAAPGCQTRGRRLVVSNACSADTTLVGVEVNETADAEVFKIVQRPTMPVRLKANQWADVTMAFAPSEVGTFSGAVALWAEGKTEPYLVRLDGEGSEQTDQTDHFVQTERPKVDILWVIDNSGSMAEYHERIANNLPAFLSFTEQQKIDYQIGVTTTGTYPMNNGCPGGAQGGEAGRLFPVDGSHPRILTPDTPNLEAHWKHNVDVGVCHGDEYAFEAAQLALSEPLINSIKSDHGTPWNDGNAGFLRPEAALSIILVMDEPERSVEELGKTVDDYLEFFLSIKGHRSDSLLRIHGIVGPKQSNPTPGCFLHNNAIQKAIDATGGTWMDLCTPTSQLEKWEAGLKAMSEGAFGYATRFVLRGLPADANGDKLVNENDIEVLINGIERPPYHAGSQVWTYDPLSNSIEFTPLFVPKPDSQLSVTYRNSCFAP